MDLFWHKFFQVACVTSAIGAIIIKILLQDNVLALGFLILASIFISAEGIIIEFQNEIRNLKK